MPADPVPIVEPRDDAIAKDEEAPAGAVSVASVRKEPPPEKPEQIRMRNLVMLSFWAIIILLGLPIWWKTTAIYRASLPLDEMMEWADGKACGLISTYCISANPYSGM